MTTMFASHAPGEVIDAIRPDLEAFTSLWSALRANYQGTNITRTVARLLHMYQPEEGVIAYERLLRTLFVLLEDFDSDGLRLLVSMVPPPKGVEDDVVKEVFFRATNFVRIDAPIFHKNTDQTLNCTDASVASSTDFPYPRPGSQSRPTTVIQESDDVSLLGNSSIPEISKSLNPAMKNDNNGQINNLAKSPQIIPHESSEFFRGFPPSEIFNTQTHVQSMKNFYLPSPAITNYANFPVAQSVTRNYVNFGQIVGQNSGQIQQPGYRPKWFPGPYLIQKNSYPVNQYQDYYLKTVNNQYVKVPASKVNNYHQASMNNSQTSYEDYLRNRSNTVTSGLLDKIQRHHSLQESAVKNILIGECDSKNVAVSSIPRVSDSELVNSQGNVERGTKSAGDHEDEMNSENSAAKSGGNFVIKTYCNLKDQENGNTISSLMSNSDVKIGVQLDLNVKNHTVNSETFEEFAKEVRMRQRAIQEDIYKMDVVRSDVFADDETDSSIKPEILEGTEELRNSCKNFISRSQTEESVEVPIFPKTRSLSAVYEDAPPVHESNLWRLLTSKNVSEEKLTKSCTENSSEPEEVVVSPSEITANKESREVSDPGIVQRRIVRRKKPDASSTRQKSQRIVQKVPTTSRDDSNLLIDRESSRLQKPDVTRNNSQSESTRYPLTSGQQTLSTQISPATTMAELAAYKKQYYDALLSIQKAKAAVANSLAVSSVGNSQGFNPYYYNYLQHQRNQILQRRQHQILMSHRGFSQSMNPANTPWFRANNWRYPVVSQSCRLPQRPQMLHPTPSMWAPSVGYLGRESSQIVSGVQSQQQTTNVVQVSKTVPMKRRKLEEIVGKLKESDNNVGNN